MRGRHIICALLLLSSACAPERANDETATELAPSYTAVSLAGDSVSLEAQRGNVVLLNIWATWCHPCREEIPVLQKLHERYSASGLRVVGVSVDAYGEIPRIRAFADEFGMTYPVWHDPNEKVSVVFRAIGVPASFLIDREGRLVWRHFGPVEADDRKLTDAISSALKPGRQPSG